MSTQQDRSYIDEPLTEQSVADYLREHPEFFERNSSLLATMAVPHACGSAVSLVEYQISILRDQNQQMKRKLKELVQLGRENDRLSERMLHLTETLIEADDLQQLLHGVLDSLRQDFKSDALALRLFEPEQVPQGTEPHWWVSRDDPGLAAFEAFFKNNRPLCGRLRSEQLAFLFGEQAGDIGSAAVVALGRHGEFGLLGIGSRDPARFHPGMGTLFLGRLGLLIGCALRRPLGAASTSAHG